MEVHNHVLDVVGKNEGGLFFVYGSGGCDRPLRDLMKVVHPKRYYIPFGGITVVFGEEFRQILPVIPYGDRTDIISANFTRSRLWAACKVFVLKHNIRLSKGNSDERNEVLSIFARWVLDIGEGQNYISKDEGPFCTEYEVQIPPQFCNVEQSNSVEKMMAAIYPNFLTNFKFPEYLSERAILTPTNQTVSHLNSLIVDKLLGDTISYYSIDRAEDFGVTETELDLAFPIEYLNSLIILGIPQHELKLKEGVVVMLIRNLNQTLGLCNVTRLIITKCLKNVVQCDVIYGSNVGTRHFIPRMECCPSDCRLPFKLIRKQMPIQICYAMTSNKSQGQSLKTTGLYLPNFVFTHDQFYVAVSRVTSPEGLHIFVDDEAGCSTSKTDNVVYKEIFYNVPTI
ncbi:uncharacterized protein LOC141665622 [Apium graveolens]|uniref:uncharacterized protein LOC141665622 n=1 Tax=Apium graveolens TaxID=4045 RepID=UPI003D7B9EB2